MASASAMGGQPSDAAIAMAVADAGSRTRSTTMTGRSKAAAREVAVTPSPWMRNAPEGSSTRPSGEAGVGVVAVAGDGADTRAVEEGPQRRRPAFAVAGVGGVLDDDVGGDGRGGRDGGGGAAGGVHAAAGLAAEPAGLDEGPLREGGREARVVAERGPDGARHGLVHVVPDEVHEGERPHPEAARSRSAPRRCSPERPRVPRTPAMLRRSRGGRSG